MRPDLEYGPDELYDYPYEPIDFDGDVYPPDQSEELNHQKNRCEGDLDDWDRLMDVSELLESAELKGRGKGKQIVGSMAVMLDGEAEYSFTVKFERLSDNEELPEGWAE